MLPGRVLHPSFKRDRSGSLCLVTSHWKKRECRNQQPEHVSMKWSREYSCGRGSVPATGTLSWLLWLYASAVRCWAGELLVTNVGSSMGRMSLGVFRDAAGRKAVMRAASQVPDGLGTEVVWRATQLSILHERKLSSSN